jgi:hypothetical protein
LGRQPEENIVEVFDALAVLAAEVDLASRRDIERDKFERRPEVIWPCGVLLILRNIVIAEEVIGRLRVPEHLCAQAARGSDKRRQHYYDRDGARGAGSR